MISVKSPFLFSASTGDKYSHLVFEKFLFFTSPIKLFVCVCMQASAFFLSFFLDSDDMYAVDCRDGL